MPEERRTAKGRWNQRGSKWEGKMKGDLRLRDQEGPHSVIRAEPRLPDHGVFSDLKGEGCLLAGKQSCGQEARKAIMWSGGRLRQQGRGINLGG